MTHSAPTPLTGPAPDPLISLFRPSHPALAAAYESPEEWAKTLRSILRQEAEQVYQIRVEQERREKMVPAEEGAELLCISGRYLLTLTRRKEIKGHRKEGTRRYYFLVGDLLDWQKTHMREDGSLKRTRRRSAVNENRKGAK